MTRRYHTFLILYGSTFSAQKLPNGREQVPRNLYKIICTYDRNCVSPQVCQLLLEHEHRGAHAVMQTCSKISSEHGMAINLQCTISSLSVDVKQVQSLIPFIKLFQLSICLQISRKNIYFYFLPAA